MGDWAKTGVELPPQSFTGRIVLKNLDWYPDSRWAPPVYRAFAQFVGTVEVTCVRSSGDLFGYLGPPRRHEGYGTLTELGGWAGFYYLYLVSVYGQFVRVAVWVCDVPGFYDPDSQPDVHLVTENGFTVEFNVGCQNLYAWQRAVWADLATRQPMDWTDRSVECAWYAHQPDFLFASVRVVAHDGTSYEASGVGGWGSPTPDDPMLVEPRVRLHAEIADFGEVGKRIIAFDSLQLNGQPLDDYLQYLDLYYPGDASAGCVPPRSPTAGFLYTGRWSRCPSADGDWFRVSGTEGAVEMWCEDEDHLINEVTPSNNYSVQWTGELDQPYIVRLVAHDGRFQEESEPYVTFDLPLIQWRLRPDGTHEMAPKEWSGEYPPGGGYILQADCNWMFEHEWRKLAGPPFQFMVSKAWREANMEDVGGNEGENDPHLNDRWAGVRWYWLTRTSFVGEPYEPLLHVQRAERVDVNDSGGGEKASCWEAVQNVEVDPDDCDVWTLTGSPATVRRRLQTRYWLRLNKLAAREPTPSYQNPDWPIMLKANLPIDVTLDDPDWWDPDKGGVAKEDIFCWMYYSFLRVALRVLEGDPEAISGTLRVTYSEVHVYDPCYTCYEHRFGAEGEWSYTRTQRQVTYRFSMRQEGGEWVAHIDLAAGGDVKVPELMVVDEIELELQTGVPCRVELTDLALEGDPYVPDGYQPLGVQLSMKRAWQWMSNWFGVRVFCDGVHTGHLPYGYDNYRLERGLLYIQKREHCPESPATTLLHYLKPMERLRDELNWQEGLTATLLIGQSSPQRVDEWDHDWTGPLPWLDLRYDPIPDTPPSEQTLQGAVITGSITPPAGVPVELHVEKFPRGGVAFLAVSGGRRVRLEPAVQGFELADFDGDGVPEERSLDRPTWLNLYSGDTFYSDQHGRVRVHPGRELALIRLRDLRGGLVGDYSVVNREYNWLRWKVVTVRGRPVVLLWDINRDLYVYYSADDGLRMARSEDVGRTWESVLASQQGADWLLGSRPGAGHDHVLLARRGEQVAVLATPTRERWSEVAVPLEGHTLVAMADLAPDRAVLVLTRAGEALWQHVVPLGEDGLDWDEAESRDVTNDFASAGLPDEGADMVVLPDGTAVLCWHDGQEVRCAVSEARDAGWRVVA